MLVVSYKRLHGRNDIKYMSGKWLISLVQSRFWYTAQYILMCYCKFSAYENYRKNVWGFFGIK